MRLPGNIARIPQFYVALAASLHHRTAAVAKWKLLPTQNSPIRIRQCPWITLPVRNTTPVSRAKSHASFSKLLDADSQFRCSAMRHAGILQPWAA